MGGAIAIAAALVLGEIVALLRHMRSPEPHAIPADRWAGYPLASHAIVAAVHLVPIAAAVVASALLSRRIGAPTGGADTVTRWGVLLAASTAVLAIVDRVARRALPLAALLKLSMVFPDRAPRRIAVARKAGSVRNLERRLAEAKALGAADEPTRAAEVILALVAALHGHDRHTRGHSERVRWFADLIAEELRLPEADRDRLRWAALLHDIGKLRIRTRILNKPSALSAAEWRHIHRHPAEGARIAAPLSEWLGEWSLTIVQHHEKFDGSGYPAGVRGEDIALGARIVAVADAFEVMTAVRAYKKAMSPADARAELTRCAGSHFDPTVVRAFLQVSVGRLRWIAGPAAWVAQLPFVGWVPRFADGAAALAGQAAGVAGAAAGAAAIGTAGSIAADTMEIPSNPPVLLEIPTSPVEQPAVRPAEVLGTRHTRITNDAPSRPASPAPAETTTTALPSPATAATEDKTIPATDRREPAGVTVAPGNDNPVDRARPDRAEVDPVGATKVKSR